MAEITASLVKELRERTGAGMMDCKKALTESGGDLSAAADWLRTKGLAAAAKKASRVAAEGLVGIVSTGTEAAVVEVNSETDFVARNEDFQAFVSQAAKIALDKRGVLDDIAAADYPGTDRTVEAQVTHLVSTLGENLSFRRSGHIAIPQGVVSSYVHGALAPGLGRIAVIVGLESEGDQAKLEAFGKQLAMHIAAAAPQAVGVDGINPAVVAKERKALAEQARESGKPDNIIDKMVEGRLRKYFEETVLLEQTFVIDNETKVEKAVEAAAKDAGAPIKVVGFVRFALGEGIAREESDFAAEVAAQVSAG